MKILVKILFVKVLIVLVSLAAYSQAGDLDDTFSADGKALFDILDLHDLGNALVVLPDTTSLVAGITIGENFVPKGFLMKVKENGEKDMDFGTDGSIIIEIGLETYPQNLVLLDNGQVLLSGFTYITYEDADLFVSRYNQDGTIDTDFGTDGTFLSDYSDEVDACYSMVVQSDGKIVCGGNSTTAVSFTELLFMRINANGTIDNSFGTNGYTTIDAHVQDESVRGLGLLSDGTIVGVGEGYHGDPTWYEKVFISMLDSSGDPVSGFGTNGVVTPDIFTDNSYCYDLAIVDNSILITGFMNNTDGERELYLAKFDDEGESDTDFGTDGMTLVNINFWNIGFSILLQGDDKILVSGTTGEGGIGDSEFFLLRFLSDGELDDSFGDGGYVTTDFRIDWDEAYSMGMQSDGKILLTGVDGGFSSSGENKIPMARYLNDYFPFTAEFTATPNPVCVDETVTFTNLSSGDVASYSWIFEGGTPATSAEASPEVTYVEPGFYDVELTVVNDDNVEITYSATDYIEAIATPTQADMPEGPAEVCTNTDIVYTTNSLQYAETYEWALSPADAGTLTGSDTSAVFEVSDSWTGDFTIKVRGGNMCDNGPWSDELSGTVYETPEEYTIEGSGEFCEGSEGVEVTLSNSQTGVDYELYLDGGSTGNIVTGTGSGFSFGFQNVEGIYTATGSNGNCEQDMLNQVSIEMINLPDEPGIPDGPDVICLETSSDYTSTGSDNADSYIWMLSPEAAGVLSSNGLDASVEWTDGFQGIAMLSLYGVNSCGDGDTATLNIGIGAPIPEVIGEDIVCDFSEETYEVVEHAGSTYTWEVTGGTITEGQNTYMINVLWDGEGNGSISVEEETEAGCDGSSNLFEVLIDDCTAIDENDENTLLVYPNPANSVLNIQMEKSSELEQTVLIFNQMGQKVLGEKINTKSGISHQIDISKLQIGLYIIKIHVDRKSVLTKQFLKQ